MNWILIALAAYLVILVLVVLRVIYDTKSPTKAMAYLLLVVMIPVVGIGLYFLVGVNLRKQKLYSEKLIDDQKKIEGLGGDPVGDAEKMMSESPTLQRSEKLVRLLLNCNHSPLTDDNEVELLVNGESKFPDVIKTLRTAKHHIHIEYFIFDDDETGREIEEVLVKKAAEGVEVRLIYDDFGSRSIRKNMRKRLTDAGVNAVPFYEINYLLLANRLNYRNHRKIIIVDGKSAYVGGINVSKRYVNGQAGNKHVFWRDTHLKVTGSAVIHLQHIFLNDWNFCQEKYIDTNAAPKEYFPKAPARPVNGKFVQIAASGPDSDCPTILFSILQAIDLAENKLEITTPYFIPGESLMDNLCIAAGAGIDVTLLVPLKGDSKVVTQAANSYYERLLQSGVRIFRYQKGFVHAKSLVVDDKIAIVGTANLDERSFDLNFEVNAIVYDETVANKLSDTFADDLVEAEELKLEIWEKRSKKTRLVENIARMFSPVL